MTAKTKVTLEASQKRVLKCKKGQEREEPKKLEENITKGKTCIHRQEERIATQGKLDKEQLRPTAFDPGI